jgi:hypothetical protein
MPAIESTPRVAGAALASNEIVSRRLRLITLSPPITEQRPARCPAASTSCRTKAFRDRKSGTAPRTVRLSSSAPSSTPYRPEPSVRSRCPPKRRRSSGDGRRDCKPPAPGRDPWFVRDRSRFALRAAHPSAIARCGLLVTLRPARRDTHRPAFSHPPPSASVALQRSSPC